MKQYRKKPVVIWAMQWDGKNTGEAMDFLGSDFLGTIGNKLFVKTYEGRSEASLKDFLIRGVEGEHYPCKPGIFDQTYEEAE